jgi:hypothetical protein
MIPTTTKQLILNPGPPLGETHAHDEEQAHEERARHAATPAGVLEQRLRKLDGEWDVERLTAVVSGLLLLVGLGLVSFAGEQWLVFPAVVAGCLLLHGLAGWTPALPLLRGLGFRTPQTIARERHALESARRDVQTAKLATAVQDREDLSRFENEGGRPGGQTAEAAGPKGT